MTLPVTALKDHERVPPAALYGVHPSLKATSKSSTWSCGDFVGTGLLGRGCRYRLIALRHGQPLPDGRMIVKQPDHQRVRLEIGLVHVGQFEEGSAVSLGLPRSSQCIPVALALEESAHGVLQGG